MWAQIDRGVARAKAELRLARKLAGDGWTVTLGAGWFTARNRGRLVRAQSLGRLVARIKAQDRAALQLELPLGG